MQYSKKIASTQVALILLFVSSTIGQVPIRSSRVITDTLTQRAGQFMFINDSTRFANYGRFDSTKIPSVPPYGSGNLVARGTLGIFYQTPLGIVRLDSTGSFVTSVTASNHLSSTGSFTPNIFMSDSTFHTFTVLDTAIDAHVRLTSGNASQVVKTDPNRYLITTPSDTVGLGALLFAKQNSIGLGSANQLFGTNATTTGTEWKNLRYVNADVQLDMAGGGIQLGLFSTLTNLGLIANGGTEEMDYVDNNNGYSFVGNNGDHLTGMVIDGDGSATDVRSINFVADSLTLDTNFPQGTGRIFDFSLSQSHLYSPLYLGFNSLTQRSFEDTLSGTIQTISDATRPQKWFLTHGSDATPVTTKGATVIISRTQNIDSTQISNKALAEPNSALAVVNVATANNYTQPVAGFFQARTNSTRNFSAGTDAVGVWAMGEINGAGTGLAGGLYAEGRRSANTGQLSAAELRVTDLGSSSAIYSPNSFTKTTGLLLTAGKNGAGAAEAGVGISFQNNGGSTGMPFKYGISFSAENTSATDSASIIDEGTAANSIVINGTHASGSIVTKNGSGDVGFGYLTPPFVASPGRQFLTLQGASDGGVVEFLTKGADADQRLLGIIQGDDVNSTVANKRRAAISFELSGSTANARGGQIRFFTARDNTSSFLERARIDSSGYFQVGATSGVAPFQTGGTHRAQQEVYLNSTNNSSLTTSIVGLYENIQFNPAGASISNIYGNLYTPTISGSSLNPTVAYGISTGVNTTAGFSGTIGSIRMYDAAPPVLSGGAATNVYGFYCNALTQGTNNYGFFSSVASAANRWNFYANGTATNYFAGNTSVGSTTTTSMFNVGTAAQFQVNSTGHINAPDITFQGVLPAVTGGTVGWDSTNRKFVGTEYQVQRAFSMNHAVITADVVDSNSAAEVTIDSIPMAANFPSVGKVIQVHLFGIYTLQNPQTFTMRLRHGGPTGVVMDSAITGSGLVTDKPWNVVTTQTFRTIGATGSVIGRIDLTTNGSIVVSNPQAAVTVNTTISNTIYITVQMTATGNNKLRVRQGWATTIN